MILTIVSLSILTLTAGSVCTLIANHITLAGINKGNKIPSRRCRKVKTNELKELVAKFDGYAGKIKKTMWLLNNYVSLFALKPMILLIIIIKNNLAIV